MSFSKDTSKFSRKLAEKELEISSKTRYKVTTIKWGYSDCEHTLLIDEENVHENIYEMTLEEFITEWMEHFNQHPDEDIIKIEQLK